MFKRKWLFVYSMIIVLVIISSINYFLINANNPISNVNLANKNFNEVNLLFLKDNNTPGIKKHIENQKVIYDLFNYFKNLKLKKLNSKLKDPFKNEKTINITFDSIKDEILIHIMPDRKLIYISMSKGIFNSSTSNIYLLNEDTTTFEDLEFYLKNID